MSLLTYTVAHSSLARTCLFPRFFSNKFPTAHRPAKPVVGTIDSKHRCMLRIAHRAFATSAMPYVAKKPNRKTVVIVGTGWAGATLTESLDTQKFKVIVVSPEETTPYTPLLASAACGLYDFR